MLKNKVISAFLSGVFLALSSLSAHAELDGPPEGRQQLVDALDAAWVRFVHEGDFRAIINKYGVGDLVINIADCLPDPNVTKYPEEPLVGTLKRVLDEGKIKVGYTDTGKIDRGSTAYYFTAMGDEVIQMLLDRIAAHYGSDGIKMETVNIPPPFLNTKFIDSGQADMLGLVNALGGSTKDDKRRRKARRYTCTMTATRQFVWMLKEGGPDWQTIDDVFAATSGHFCAGPLANELTKTYFRQNGRTGKTEFVADLANCLPKLVNGKAQAMINPLPHEKYFPEFIDVDGDGKAETKTAGLFRAIDTNIVAGTPLWVPIN
jgi:hypothetical protein